MKFWAKQNETNAFIIRFLKVFTILTCVVNFLERYFPGGPVDKNLHINASVRKRPLEQSNSALSESSATTEPSSPQLGEILA